MARTRSKPRLLVVEDDGGIREFLADALRQYELVFAACQSECYAQLNATELDLVLLDLALPRTPGEMKPVNQVGIDILDEIRRRGMTKPHSDLRIPVIVMTAHGNETISVSMLKDHHADDYIPKPFGEGPDLEHKIARALAGTGALMPATSSASPNAVQLSFHPNQALVRIETITYESPHLHKLLCLLRDMYLRDQAALLRLDEYKGMRAGKLAATLQIAEKALVMRVAKFREDVARDFRAKYGRTLGKNDIIHNTRDWGGYRLNPYVVRIVRWNDHG